MIFGATLAIMHRALSQEKSLAITNIMVSAVTFTLLRCNSTTPTTTRQLPFLKALVVQAVLQLLVLVRSILHWTQQVEPMLSNPMLRTGTILFIQRWTGTQLGFLTWPSWHSINRMANKLSTRVTTASTTHNQEQQLAISPVTALRSINPSPPSTLCTTLQQTRGLSMTPQFCSKTTWTASILVANQSSSALLRTGAFTPIRKRAKPFPKGDVKPVNRSTLLWFRAGSLATVTALIPTNPETLYMFEKMFEKFVYPICRKK